MYNYDKSGALSCFSLVLSSSEGLRHQAFWLPFYLLYHIRGHPKDAATQRAKTLVLQAYSLFCHFRSLEHSVTRCHIFTQQGVGPE